MNQRFEIKVDIGDVIFDAVFAAAHVAFTPPIVKVVQIEVAVDEGIQVNLTKLEKPG